MPSSSVSQVTAARRVIDLDTRNFSDNVAVVLLEVAQTVATVLETDTALERLASLALRALGAERCAILVLEGNGASGRLIPAAAASLRPSRVARERFFASEPIEIGAHPGLRSTWSSPGPVAIETVAHSTFIPDGWRQLRSRSIALSPLRAGDQAFGLLVVDFVSKRHRFSSEELSLLDAIACSAGVALRNARLFVDLNRSVEFERRLVGFTSTLLSGGSLQETLETVLEGFQGLLGVTHCAINMLRQGGDRFVTLASHGWDAPAGDRTFDEFPQEDIRLVEAQWKRDPRETIRIRDLRALRSWSHLVPADVGPGMLIPIADAERLLGFVVAGRTGSREFSDEELRVANAFAAQAALALREAELREAAGGRARALDAVRQLSDVIVGTTDLRTALAALNRGACRDMGMECTRVTFSDPDLCALLCTAQPTPDERVVMREWRRAGSDRVRDMDGGLLLPVRLRGRVAGLIRVVGDDGDPGVSEFLQVLSDGIGDVVYKAKMRQSSERKAGELAIAADRERMARDLHDTVGPILYGLSLRAQSCLRLDDGTPETMTALRAGLEEVSRLAAQGVSDVRGAVYALSFLHVRKAGLVRSLRALAKEFERTTGIGVEVRVPGRAGAFDPEVEGALYRVAHEALVNVDRHSRATGVILTLESSNGSTRLMVRDDGIGLDQRQSQDWRSAAHFGLRMMARCIRDVGGTFTAQSADPRGLVIAATIPRNTKTR